MTNVARWFVNVTLLMAAHDAIALFDFGSGSVHTVDHLLAPSHCRSPVACYLDDSETFLKNKATVDIERIVGSFDIQQQKKQAQPEFKPEFENKLPEDDPVFNHWVLFQAGSGKSREELYQMYRELTPEEKEALRRQWSMYHDAKKEVLIYGPLISARGETTEEYLQSRKIVPPHVIRLLGKLRFEAAVRDWLSSNIPKTRGDDFQQELVESEGTASKHVPVERGGRLSTSTSKKTIYTASVSLAGRRAAGGGGGDPHKPSRTTVWDYRDEDDERRWFIDGVLSVLGLKIIHTRADHSCMYHAISGQLPLFNYRHSGLELRGMATEFLSQLQENDLPPEMLSPNIVAGIPDSELFEDWELEAYNDRMFTELRPRRIYLRIISSFKGDIAAPELPEFSPEFPVIKSITSKQWGDDIYLTILSDILSFYTIVLSKTASGMQVIIMPPGGGSVFLDRNNLDSVNRLFKKISPLNRTLTMQDFVSWVEKERTILDRKLETTTQGTAQYKRFTSWQARFSEQFGINQENGAIERPVVVLLYEMDLAQPHWSQLNFIDEDRRLDELYKHNSGNQQLMRSPEVLRSDLLAWRPDDKKQNDKEETVSADDRAEKKPEVTESKPEPVKNQLDESELSDISEPPPSPALSETGKEKKVKTVSEVTETVEEQMVETVKEEVAETVEEKAEADPAHPPEEPKKRSRKKKKRKKKESSAGTENGSAGFEVEEEIVSSKPVEVPAPKNGAAESGSNGAASGEDVSVGTNPDTRAKNQGRSRKKRRRVQEAPVEPKEKKEEKNQSIPPKPEVPVFTSRQSEKKDIEGVVEWMTKIDEQLTAHLSENLESLKETLRASPVPESLDTIMEQGLLKTSIALKQLDAEKSGPVIHIRRKNIASVMPLVREAAFAHHCPYGNLLYAILITPDNSFSEQRFSDVLMPLLHAAVAGVVQAMPLMSAMLLNHHPAGHPQIALWNELMDMISTFDTPLEYYFHFVEPEFPLLEALHKDHNFGNELSIRQIERYVTGKPTVTEHVFPYQLGQALKTRKFEDIELEPGDPYAKTKALLRLLTDKRSNQPAAGQLKNRYWQKGLKIVGLPSKKMISPVREAIPLLSSDLALYDGMNSLVKAEAALSQFPEERPLARQFKELFEVIVMLTTGSKAESESIYQKLDPSLLNTRLYKAIFQIRQESEHIVETIKELQQIEDKTNAPINTLLGQLNDILLAEEGNENPAKSANEKKSVTEVAEDDSAGTADPDTADQAREWLKTLDQRVPKDMQREISADGWIKKAEEAAQQASEVPGKQVLAGYYYFMAAIKHLRGRWTRGSIVLDRLETAIAASGIERILGYLDKSNQSGFPYASLLQAIVKAYAFTGGKKKESFDKQADFFLAINERLFEACWSGVEQAYSMMFLASVFSHPWGSNVGIIALFLRLFDQEKPRYQLVFRVSHNHEVLKNVSKYRMILFNHPEVAVFDQWLDKIRTKPLPQVLKSRMKKITKSLTDQITSMIPDFPADLAGREDVESDLSYFRTLAAVATENISFLEESEKRYFAEWLNILWLPQLDEESWICSLSSIQTAARDIAHTKADSLSLVRQEHYRLLDRLLSKGAKALPMPTFAKIAKTKLEALLLLSDPISSHPHLIDEVRTFFPGMPVSSQWRSRILLLHQRLAKLGAGLSTIARVPLLIKDADQKVFQRVEKHLALLLSPWQTMEESEYPHLLQAAAELNKDFIASDSSRDDPEDLVNLELWRTQGDSYFVDCYNKALKLKWSAVQALAKKYGTQCTTCSDADQAMKQGIYEAILGLLKLGATVNPEATGFNIDMMGSFDQHDLRQADEHFSRARNYGFPYGGYLSSMTVVYKRKTGYWSETKKEGDNVVDYYSGIDFYADIVPGLVESAIAGSRQALLDLIGLFNLAEHRSFETKNVGLTALLTQWHLLTQYPRILTFNVCNMALSAFTAIYYSKLNGPIKEIVASGFASCTGAEESCFIQTVRQEVATRTNLPLDDAVYIELLLAVMTDDPGQLIKLIERPGTLDVTPIHLLPALFNWIKQLERKHYVALISHTPAQINLDSCLRFLGLSMTWANSADPQKNSHTQLIEIIGRTQAPVFYGTFDPFVTHEVASNNLLATFGDEMPGIAEWFAIHHFIRYLMATEQGLQEEALKQHRKIKGLIEAYGDIRPTLKRLAVAYEFFRQQQLSFD